VDQPLADLAAARTRAGLPRNAFDVLDVGETRLFALTPG
jgi:hypothetical protein